MHPTPQRRLGDAELPPRRAARHALAMSPARVRHSSTSRAAFFPAPRQLLSATSHSGLRRRAAEYFSMPVTKSPKAGRRVPRLSANVCAVRSLGSSESVHARRLFFALRSAPQACRRRLHRPSQLLQVGRRSDASESRPFVLSGPPPRCALRTALLRSKAWTTAKRPAIIHIMKRA